MAGMFYSLKEAAERLGKTEDELKELIKQRRLREFRDGPNLLLKVNEVEAVAREEGIELAPEAPEREAPPPLATVPSAEQAQAEPEMPEPAAPEAEAPELEASTLDENEVELERSDLADLEPSGEEIGEPKLDLSELGPPEPEEQAPAAEGKEPAAADAAPGKTPAAEEVSVKKKPAKKKRARKPKPPRAKAVAAAPSHSFTEWLLRGLQEDDIVAVFVFVVLLVVIIGACVGAGYLISTLV